MSTAVARARHLGEADHPLLRALARAPIGEPLTPEQRTQLDEQMEAIREGRVQLVPQEERGAWLAAHAPEIDDPNA